MNTNTNVEATLVLQDVFETEIVVTKESQVFNLNGSKLSLSEFQFRMFAAGIAQNSRIYFMCNDE